MTNEEKLRVFAAYLPYDLKLQHKYQKAKHNGETVLRSWVKPLEPLDLGCLFPHRKDSFDWKPILYPLEYLTKEIEYEGKMIMPMNHFIFKSTQEAFEGLPEYNQHLVNYIKYDDVKQLLKWHFNVFGLKESQFINKATLTNK